VQRSFENWLPGLTHMRRYERSWLRADVLASITVLAVLLPAGMAYGELAGAPPVTGLYAAIGAMVLYAFVTSTRIVIVGPDAGIAIIVASALAPFAVGQDVARYMALAGVLALLVGVVLIAGGFAKIGFIADFVSEPVLSGYIIGAAGIMIASQVGKLFGISLENDDFFPKIWELITKLDQTHRLTFLIGLLLIAILLVLRRIAPKAPGAFIVLVISTAASAIFKLDQHGVATLGAIPAGLPALTIPSISAGDIRALFPASLGVALLAFSEGALTARVFAEKRGEAFDADQELLAFGAANLGAALTQGFPVGVSQTRTLVNDASGGKSQVVSLIAAVVLGLFLLFFTRLLEPLPSVALGAIVVVAALGLIKLQPLRELAHVDRVELAISLVALLGVLVFGILEGILVAVALSLLLLLARITNPHDALLVRDEGGDGFHEVEGGDLVQAAPGLIVYRFDAPLFFANAPRFQERVKGLAERADAAIRCVVVDVEPAGILDTTAAAMLVALRAELLRRGIALTLARVSSELNERLRRTGATEAFGEQNLFSSLHEAVEAYEDGQP
jgi:sulfate permease, SulP family